MRSEKYTEDEIETKTDYCNDYNDYLLKKYSVRWQIRLDPNRKILPLIWNRWKGFVAIRKLIKY